MRTVHTYTGPVRAIESFVARDAKKYLSANIVGEFIKHRVFGTDKLRVIVKYVTQW
jgi:hypothetical protein